MKSWKEGHLPVSSGLFFSPMDGFLNPLVFWLILGADRSQWVGRAAAGLVHKASGGTYCLLGSQIFTEGERGISAPWFHWRSWPHPQKRVLIISFPSWWLPASLHFPLPSFVHCQQRLLGCRYFEMELHRRVRAACEFPLGKLAPYSTRWRQC